jgi:hypothetical protein
MWGVSATVDAFPTLDDIPVGSWPVVIMDNIQAPGADGFHSDQNNQPFALVQYSNTWSLTVSHETLEMLADPSGNRMQGGPSPNPRSASTQVQLLVEVCDPCEDAQFAYSINGVLVSDFITPRFYDAVASAGTHYSFTGAITAPRQILEGGYISFLDPKDGHMRQMIWPNGAPKPKPKDLGVPKPATGSLREFVDRRTSQPQWTKGASKSVPAVAHAIKRERSTAPVRAARAKTLRAAIDQALEKTGSY